MKEAVGEKKEAGTAAVKAVEAKAAEVKEKEKAVVETVKEKKPGRPAKKPAKAAKAAKEEMKPEVVIQFQGNEAVVEEAIEKAKAQYVAEGHRVSSIKTLKIYLKPEEYAAYYVINDKFAGRVDLF